MAPMPGAITVERPIGRAGLEEFLLFHDRVYERRAAARLEFLPLLMPILLGTSPFSIGREVRPFVARDRGEVVARVLALVDRRYQDHWGESLGHLVLFEALASPHEATRQLMDAACGWLAERGCVAARAGMGMLELPFAIDEYDRLPPLGVRQNPDYYHRLLKDAGFETERGWVDYHMPVSTALIERWRDALDAATRAGFRIVPLRDVAPSDRMEQFTETHNDTFSAHWGFSPFSVADLSLLVDLQTPIGALDVSVLAYRDAKPVGMVWAVPESADFARYLPGRRPRAEERVNFLGIGVKAEARGRGVNLAMAAYAYLELVRRGARHLSYTLVLDDNWPSRRTAEKLGASVCANYVTYRRTL